MTLGTTLILCMLCTIALGVAKPMLDRLKIGKGAAMIAAFGAAAALPGGEDGCVFFLLLPCLCWLVELRWVGRKGFDGTGRGMHRAACFGL